MEIVNEIRAKLNSLISIPKEKQLRFFKTGKGEYGEHDSFIGVKVPDIRKLAKEYINLDLCNIEKLIHSVINEERQLGLYILTAQYKKADISYKTNIYNFYLKNLKYINNWNLVDASAHLIIGDYLLNIDIDKDILFNLAESKIMWERRIAIVSTWYFIRNNKFDTTFAIAEILINDQHDLIHKAVGWMLREAGKKDERLLIDFLEKFAHKMPRTMLRYSIEKFNEELRQKFLKIKLK